MNAFTPNELPNQPQNGPVDIFGPDSPLETPFAKDLLRSLIGTIWTPEDETEEEQHLRYHAAFTALAALGPRDPVEQMLAAQAVGAHNAVMECFRRAMLPELDPRIADRLRANAATMGRMMRDTLCALKQRMSSPLPPTAAQREAREAARAAYAERPVSPEAQPAPNRAQHPMHPEERVPSPNRVTSAGQEAGEPAAPTGDPSPKHPMHPEEERTQPRSMRGLLDKIPNGDPIRDFLSRRFLPGENVEEAWAIAQREAAEMEAAELAAADRAKTPHTP
jgi:hypothetical protein